MALKKRHLAVFDSIFKVDGQARIKITWADFIRAMAALNFAYGPSGEHTSSSGRALIPPASIPGHPMKLDCPHGGKEIGRTEQAELASRLREFYDLEEVLKVLTRVEQVPQQAQADE
ncbi:hypothetical protein L227DRAFT_617607 [Lentinus tigrinus ALCF2SS1-6]|uniref:Uncharacterized protein n=1 Tax=Lentinus tigrinus ALCF2SS1-6 TaxID=1328759 RepID=A0A5C2RMY3_9APHY|nr:hypothetical protein L227DRAFT_617607 [Lentinus tigrinus ALCF2SS1-6]